MLDDAMMEAMSRSIAESDYEGWVAWVDGQPIFEAVPHQPQLTQAARGAHVLPVRAPDRNTCEWKKLPHDRIQRLELYYARDRYEQPAARLDRQPGNDGVRFIQMKLSGVTISAGTGVRGDHFNAGQQRLGIMGYRIGFWNPAANECMLFEYTRNGRANLGTVAHPCWPQPWGFGLAPWVVGLTEADVPAIPAALNVAALH